MKVLVHGVLPCSFITFAGDLGEKFIKFFFFLDEMQPFADDGEYAEYPVRYDKARKSVPEEEFRWYVRD